MPSSTIDLGVLAAKKNFKSFTDHPYTTEEDVPFFSFYGGKGKPADLVVQGSDKSELVQLGEMDDLANMGGGDDAATGALGSDTLNGGDGNDFLFGDTDVYIARIAGDDDVLSGDAGNDLLIGDAPNLYGGATGGNDTLSGGAGDDTLWGDGILDAESHGGTDTFVFAPGGGDDVIMDFRQEDHDVIDVSAYGITGMDDLGLSSDGPDTVIDLGGGDSVTLAGFGDLTLLGSEDFTFA